MKRWHIVAYDVAHPKRLRQVHRCLSRHAIPVQHSVFLFHGSARGLNELLTELEALIDARKDDVRAYPSAHPGRMWLSQAVSAAAECVPEDAPLLVHAQDASEGFWHGLWRKLGRTA